MLYNLSEYEIPRIVDSDGDTVALTELFNNGSSFISLAESSTPNVSTGTLTIDAS
jgi:hypothetical protein